MVKRKLSRKELKEDEVLDFFQSAYRWIQKNVKLLSLGAVVILIIILSVWGITSLNRSRETRSGHILAESLAGDSINRELLSDLTDKYKRTKAGRLASILLSVNSPEDDKKIDEMENFFNTTGDRAMRSVLFNNIITMLIDKKDYEGALSRVNSLGEKVSEDLKLYMNGMVFEAQMNYEEAKVAYQKISTSFPSSPYASLAQTRLQYL